jgi:multidrug resistance efflux pump
VSLGILLAVLLTVAAAAYSSVRPWRSQEERRRRENAEELDLERRQQEDEDDDRRRQEVRRRLEQQAEEEERRWQEDRDANEVPKSPLDGVVLERLVEPGELASAGSTLIVVADLDALTLKVYVPEDRYGQVSLGESYPVFVDSFPGETFRGTVSHIADEAQFTPRNVHSGRSQEYGVRRHGRPRPVRRQVEARHAGRCQLRGEVTNGRRHAATCVRAHREGVHPARA